MSTEYICAPIPSSFLKVRGLAEVQVSGGTLIFNNITIYP